MYISLNKLFLEKTQEEANKEAIAELGNDGKNLLIYSNNLSVRIDSLGIDDDGTISVTFTTNLGDFSVEIPLDNNTLELILSAVIKRMNKIKTLLESLR